MLRPHLALVLLLACGSAGCASFHTTIVDRLDNDSLIADPCQGRCLRGVPVTLRVPTHVEVRITETQMLVSKKHDDGKATAEFVPDICGGRKVATQMIYTKKVFLVDFKRPAAGTLDLAGTDEQSGLQFDQEQFFSSVNAKVEERTIRDITEVVSTFPKTPSTNGAAKEASARYAAPASIPTNGLLIQDSIVAIERFDINEPGWEDRMNQFVEYHLKGG
jgi:hypothetical protein